jgi:hypothetical protein
MAVLYTALPDLSIFSHFLAHSLIRTWKWAYVPVKDKNGLFDGLTEERISWEPRILRQFSCPSFLRRSLASVLFLNF